MKLKIAVLVFAAAAVSGCITTNTYDLAKGVPELQLASQKTVSEAAACLNAAYNPNPANDISVPDDKGRAFLLGMTMVSVQPNGAGSKLVVYNRAILKTYVERAKSCA